jgi:hypothetical protein
VPVLVAASAAVAWFALLVRTWQPELIASVPGPAYSYCCSCMFPGNRGEAIGLRPDHLHSCFRRVR